MKLRIVCLKTCCSQEAQKMILFGNIWVSTCSKGCNSSVMWSELCRILSWSIFGNYLIKKKKKKKLAFLNSDFLRHFYVFILWFCYLRHCIVFIVQLTETLNLFKLFRHLRNNFIYYSILFEAPGYWIYKYWTNYVSVKMRRIKFMVIFMFVHLLIVW